MVIDYSDISDTIVNSIESYTSHSFKHVDRIDWLDAEGTFPQGLVGGSFSVFMESADDNEILVSEETSLLEINVQFALDGRHGNYVEELGYAQDAVLNLQDVSGSYFKIQKVQPWFTCETLGSFVRVEFENVQFIVPNR